MKGVSTMPWLRRNSTHRAFFFFFIGLVMSFLSLTIEGRRCHSSVHQKQPSRQLANVRHGARVAAFTTPSEATLWKIRIASALTSYVMIVGYLDRPRGRLSSVDGVEVRPSTVAGLGLFATQYLPQGTVLGTYPGVLIPLNQWNMGKLRNYPACESYIWRFSDNRFVIDPTNAVGELEPYIRGGNSNMPGSNLLFQTLLFWLAVPTTLCRINEPPIGKDVNVITEEDLDRRCVTFLLERDVQPGEELFVDYGLTYDRSMYQRKNDGTQSTGNE